MQNYFNYFTEIEEHFQRRRGSLILLSTIDWALIETWREAGVPLEAVLRGIDDAFDKYDERKLRAHGRLRKVNGLAWCAQSVMEAAEALRDAAVGVGAATPAEKPDSGFESERIAAFFSANADALDSAKLDGASASAVSGITARLRSMAAELQGSAPLPTEKLEVALTALEERLFAALTLSAGEDEIVAFREQAARELAAYRGRMSAVQLRQVTEQFVHKRLLQSRGLPRLSLFYMELG